MLNGGIFHRKKSREIGLTWLVSGCGMNLWLFTPGIVGLMTSRKEELVDKKGNPDCLFWKLDFLLKNLPEWAIPSHVRTERHLENKWNGSVIDGETTNVDVGAGGRRTWSFCDEFQAVAYPEAESISRTLSDTAACKIYVGTVKYKNHPFSKIGRRKGVNSKFLGWWLHPHKNKGLYYSPDINKIVIEDIDYYKNLAPRVFDKYDGKEIKYSDLETEILYEYPTLKMSFIADGGAPNKPKWRSPWYDKQEEERDPLDTAINLDGNEIGSGDNVFSQVTLDEMSDLHVKKPDTSGEITYNLNDNKITNIKFLEGSGRKLKWWGQLAGARPAQNHNYVLGCDISLGQGQSNSVCSIFDVDNRKKVGNWADAYTLPEQFAEKVYAIGQWVGGASGVPFLNFENNGIGQVFGKRIKELGYSFIYKTTTEKKGFHQKLNTIGWTSTTNTKLELLMNYNAALTACFRGRMKAKMFINPDEDAIKECEDYIFHGNQITLTHCIEDSGGAKAAHGDRVIADALCNLAAGDQPIAAQTFAENIIGTVQWRMKRQRDRELQKKDKVKLWLNF